MFEKLKRKYEDRKKRKCIGRIRQEMGFWGYDLASLSDEDIEKACMNLVKAWTLVSKTLPTAKEAGERFAIVASILRGEQKNNNGEREE